jgi:hypothetical protein
VGRISARDVAAGAIGAAAAVGVDVVMQRTAPQHRTPGAALGLVGAALIYPVARRGRFGDAAEKLVLGAATVTSLMAHPDRRRLVAAGWLAHALFDAQFAPGSASRIPRWYPAMCAGYDVALAARLAQ